jgi:Zn-dependent protease
VEAELRRRAAAAAGPASASEPPGPPPAAAPGGISERLQKMGPLGGVLVLLFSLSKYVGVGLKFLLPALKTGGTMFISIWFYAMRDGWPFAVGFVLGIFVHEMGHVFMAWRLGIPVSAPLFIPFMGALILQKRAGKSAWEEALIGIGGPIAGTLAGLVFLALHLFTGWGIFLGLAYTTFFINLFNMAPLFPLDGGWIVGAVSPRLWLIGLLLIGGLFLAGWIRNPLLLLLLLLSAPRIWHGLKTGEASTGDVAPATPRQRTIMGVSYVALCALLLWLVGHTHATEPIARPGRPEVAQAASYQENRP